MSSFRVVSFYTVNTQYENIVKNLVASCKYPITTLGYPSRGSWERNCAIKSEFCLKMLQEHKENILWVDADAVIRSSLSFYDTFTGDIGAHLLKGKELLSGTIFFRNIPRVQALVYKWVAMQRENPEAWDQRVLQQCIEKYAKGLGVTFVDTPARFTKIYDHPAMRGDTAIEHFQASRELRKSFMPKVGSPIPEEIGGVRVRIHADGSFSVPRCKRQFERDCDFRFTRIPGEYRWLPKTKEGRDMMELAVQLQGKHIYVIGKGPSLDNVSRNDFPDPDAVVICVNESIHQIEKLGLPNKVFAIQQDAQLKDTCNPQFGGIIISYQARNWYAKQTNKFIYWPEDYGLTSRDLTATVAITLARAFGATKFTLLCFDACVNKKIAYAKCVGYPSFHGGPAERFLTHKLIFEKAAGNVPLVWELPSDPPSIDKLSVDGGGGDTVVEGVVTPLVLDAENMSDPGQV